MLSIVMHVALILFFAWVLLHHALIYSKSVGHVIEGLEGNGAMATTATTATATTATTATATTATASPATPTQSQTQIDEIAAQIAILKSQILNLTNISNQLNAAMAANEKGVQQNTDLIQKVVQSQNDTNTKLANMKSTK
jgi:hypothetical protein